MRDARLALVALLPAAMVVAPAAAQGPEAARCSLDYAPDLACTVSDEVENGVHHMTFRLDGREVIFVGRSQTGWWSGELDGRPAMGFERNRGHVVFSTTDLEMVFAWWYPGQEHGSY